MRVCVCGCVCVCVHVRGVVCVCVCARARAWWLACATSRPLPATGPHLLASRVPRRHLESAADSGASPTGRSRESAPRVRSDSVGSSALARQWVKFRNVHCVLHPDARGADRYHFYLPQNSSATFAAMDATHPDVVELLRQRPAPSPRRERQPSARSRSRSTAQPAPGGSAKGGLPLQERRSPGQPRAGSERRQRRHGRGGSVVVVVVVSFWQRPYGRGKQASHACRCTACDGSVALLRTMWLYRQVRRPCSVRTACATLAATSSSVGTAGTSVPPVVKLAERPSVA